MRFLVLKEVILNCTTQYHVDFSLPFALLIVLKYHEMHFNKMVYASLRR